jgi:serine/threonine protein kinase/WD40 repeat protein
MQTNHVTDWQGKMLGRYRLLRLVGRGGMGEVWQAEDTELHRQVAAKMLPPVVANETDYLRAFAAEARTAASLEHPHILQVHDFGEQPFAEDVVTYLIMPLITGGSLRDRMRATNGALLSVDESMHYLRHAAQAIDYAHSRNVLHRDIKPGNMLLQQSWLLLADFGLAKLLSNNTFRSRTHAGAGTPEYMAPEQIQGKAEAASDRYSLAVIAYQLFTGRLPFSGKEPFEILLKHMQEPPTLPRQFNSQLPQTIENTLLKGLAKQPAARPGSCTAFVNELEMGWKLGEQATTADPEATLLAPWNKHHIANQPTHLVSPSTPGMSASSASAPWGLLQNSMPSATATNMMPENVSTYVPPANGTAERPAEQQHKIGRRGVMIAGASVAAVAVVGATGLAAYLHFKPSTLAAPKPPPGPYKLIAGVPLLRLIKHTGVATSVAWHPSGRYLATGSNDTHVMLWDVGSLLPKATHGMQKITTPLHEWKFADGIDSNRMGWSADGRTLAVIPQAEASGAPSTIIHMINDQQSTTVDYIDKKQANAITPPTYYCLAWSPVGDTLAVSTFTETDVKLWQRGNTNGPIKTFPDLAAQKQGVKAGIEVNQLAWSYDASMVAGAREDSHVDVWETETGKVLQSFALPDSGSGNGKNQTVLVRRGAITWSPNVRNQLVTSQVDIAPVLDVHANKVLYSLSTNDPDALITTTSSLGIAMVPQINGLAWSPNGRYIAGSYEHSHQVYIWDTQNKAPKTTKKGFHLQDMLFGKNNGHLNKKGCTIVDLAWSPDGRYLATASNDTTVIIWKMDGS